MSIASVKNSGSAHRATKQTATSQFTPAQIEDAHRFLSDNLDPADLNPSKLAQDGRDKIISALQQAVNDRSVQEAPQNASDLWLKSLYNNTIGLGVLEEFLANPSVEQINVQGPQKIILQTKGVWTEVNDPEMLFKDVNELRTVAANIVRCTGKELSEHTNPIIDIRFENPLLRIHINQTRRDHGLAIYIRRGRTEPFTIDSMIEAGSFNHKVLHVLQNAAKRLIGCVFLGSAGSGKTVMLEKYIDWLPNVPIAVVDAEGDCQPNHPMCAIFDLPETSYNPNTQMNLTLGGMTRAALREGDVLCVAETRGSEEAGILISDAPSMRCVITTAHGQSATSGLSRLVSIAQRPPSPYAGISNSDALRNDLSNAFPLVVHMNRRGNQRFVNGIYQNMGWNSDKGDWNLRPIVLAKVSNRKRIKWDVIDSDLDKIKTFVSLDIVKTNRVTVDEPHDTQSMLADALHKVDEHKWVEAVHLLSILVKSDPNNEALRKHLTHAIEHTDDYQQILVAAKQEAIRLERLVKQRLWNDARSLLKDLQKQPSVYAFIWRLHRSFTQTQKRIDEGYDKTNEAIRIIQEGRELMRGQQRPWTELRSCLSSLQALDTTHLSDETKAGVKFTHANLLVALINRAPQANAQFYRQKLDAFIGKEEARRRLNARVN